MPLTMKRFTAYLIPAAAVLAALLSLSCEQQIDYVDATWARPVSPAEGSTLKIDFFKPTTSRSSPGSTSGSHLQDRLRRGHALRERLRLRHGAKGFARADQFGDARHAAHRLARLLGRQALLLARRADARPRGAHLVAAISAPSRWSRASPTPATARSTEPASSSSTTVR